MDRHKLHKFKRLLDELKTYRGRHTELVSVYIPAGYELHKIINHLAQEQGTAANIKDKTTRNNVIASLERMIRHLRLFKQTPLHGLAVFSGNASEREGQPDIKVWSIEPPQPLNMRLYRCDQTFVVDELEKMLQTDDVYGLIVIDNREGTVGLLKGTHITIIKDLHSMVPGKIKAGGQCLDSQSSVALADGQSVLLSDLQEGDEVLSYDFSKKEQVTGVVEKIWQTTKDVLYELHYGSEALRCSGDHVIFLADGTEVAVSLLEKGARLLGEECAVVLKDIVVLQKKSVLIDVQIDVKNFFVDGILVHNSQQRFARLREIAAKEFYDKVAEVANKEFLAMVTELKGILVGGPGITKETFLSGHHLNQQLKDKVLAVKDLSYTGDFGLKELIERCQEVLANEAITQEKNAMEKLFLLLAKTPEKVSYGRDDVKHALALNAVDTLLVLDDAHDVDQLEDKAEEMGSSIVVITKNTDWGAQLESLGGIAAILRFPLS